MKAVCTHIFVCFLYAQYMHVRVCIYVHTLFVLVLVLVLVLVGWLVEFLEFWFSSRFFLTIVLTIF